MLAFIHQFDFIQSPSLGIVFIGSSVCQQIIMVRHCWKCNPESRHQHISQIYQTTETTGKMSDIAIALCD
jgi:hypothetical protein